jgi:methylmalonyl-CoA mutase N-terminal domain/subunit
MATDDTRARPRERKAKFTTLSGEPIEPLYTEADLPEPSEIGRPGEYPFTRGVYENMYRGRLWTMRQFAGFGTAEETNERFRYLLDHGQTGLSTAFDMPSLMGHDSDHPKSLGEVGREGVAVDVVDDMETLFQGIDLGDVSVSMTINAPAAIMLAYYVVAAERQGVPGRPARRDDPGRHPQGVHRPEGVVLPDRPGDAACSATWSSGARPRCRAGTRSRSPATTSARPARPPRRSSRSRSRTG